MVRGKRVLTLQWRIVFLVCIVLWLAFLASNVLITNGVTRSTQGYLNDKLTSVSRMVANSEIVIEGLQGKRSIKEIDAYANKVESLTGIQFIVILDNELLRYDYPIRGLIEEGFSKSEDGSHAARVDEYIPLEDGEIGIGKQVFTPVIDEFGNQIGSVLAGISIEAVNLAIGKSRLNIYMNMLIGLGIGIIGAGLLGTRVKSILFNLEPFEIAKLLKEREAMLDSVIDGVIAVDCDLKVTLVNQGVARILNVEHMTSEMTEKYINEYKIHLQEVLSTGKKQLHIEKKFNQVPVIFNCVPIIVENKVVGALGTLQDKSELKKISKELMDVQLYTDTLRAQSHEFINKLHVVLGLVQMKDYEKLNQYIQQVVHQAEKEVDFIVDKIKCPVFAGFLLGKYSKAREEDIDFVLTGDSFLPEISENGITHQLIEIVGNLINNAMEALRYRSNKKITLSIRYELGVICIEISDSGGGIKREIRDSIFEKGFSTKGENRGLGLYMIGQTLQSLKGEIELYTQVEDGTTFNIRIPYQKN